jgi:hypothetical protein
MAKQENSARDGRVGIRSIYALIVITKHTTLVRPAGFNLTCLYMNPNLVSETVQNL